jgi:glycosyltransferase involved in cell wall biosynthesis
VSAPILIVGSYADPEPIGGNRTLAMQAIALRELGERVEVLTWPHNDTWRGPLPDGRSRLAGVPYHYVQREGIGFHVVECPPIWAERSMNNREWGEAVMWGVQALEELRPRILHQQFWQNLWWMMEAAQCLGIPTIYSAHDYGIACLRTVLVNGRDELCDGQTSIDTCSRCVFSGRNGIGKANELVARLPVARPLLAALFGSDGRGPLARAGGVRLPVKERVRTGLNRCHRTLGRASAVIVASPFASDFFRQFVTDPQRIHVIPWFHTQRELLGNPPDITDVLRLAIATRISPDKGVHILLQALESVECGRAIELKIAGVYDNHYGRELFKRYTRYAGRHKVEWCGWIPNDGLVHFYGDVHAVIVPSLWYDNTPLALVEALAHGRPVICTDVPSMTHLVKHEVNGLVFPLGDAAALASQIRRLASSPGFLSSLAKHTRNVIDVMTYARKLKDVYGKVVPAVGQRSAADEGAIGYSTG